MMKSTSLHTYNSEMWMSGYHSFSRRIETLLVPHSFSSQLSPSISHSCCKTQQHQRGGGEAVILFQIQCFGREYSPELATGILSGIDLFLSKDDTLKRNTIDLDTSIINSAFCLTTFRYEEMFGSLEAW